VIRYKGIGEGPEWNEFLSTLLWMVFVSSAATLMGLLLSALVDTTEKVMSIVPISLIPQIMLAGIVAKITTPAVEILSYLTLARWGTEGLSNIQETVYSPIPAVNDDGSEDYIVDAVEKLNMQFHESYEDTFGEMASELSLDIIAIGLLSLLFFIGIYIALKKKDAINQ
jgi:ABC-type multidrug transport system permease subunit